MFAHGANAGNPATQIGENGNLHCLITAFLVIGTHFVEFVRESDHGLVQDQVALCADLLGYAGACGFARF